MSRRVTFVLMIVVLWSTALHAQIRARAAHGVEEHAAEIKERLRGE